MRLVAVASIIAACIAGAALAQDGSSMPVEDAQFVPHWEPGNHVRRLYPQRALRRGVAGITHLCCTARPDRSMDCNVAIEWPERYGFADSALQFAREQRLTQESYAELQTRQNQGVQVAIRWHVAPEPPEFADVVRQVREQAAGLCGEGSGPVPDYIEVEVQRLRGLPPTNSHR